MDVWKKHINAIFDGRYQIVDTVGEGGMAVVYKATDLKTGDTVALKMLKDSISDNPQALRRFINESKAVAMMDHANIVKILDVSVKTEHKFIVMEYIKGITLRDYMTKKVRLSWQEATAFLAQILQALDHAHMRGVIHRDIKPQNIMVMEGGFIKVADFGIAKLPNAETVTMIDHAVGTIYYISPEQARGKKIDPRSDLYSLGVMFYEMLTGELPFMADTSYAIMTKHINEAPTPPRQLVPQLPVGIEQIILCSMEKDPARRYQSASQMLRHIYRIQQNPTTVFQKQPSQPRTTNADIVAKKAEGNSDQYIIKAQQTVNTPMTEHKPTRPQNAGARQSYAQTNTKKPTQLPNPNRKKSESAPFSVVILICAIFFILAAIGFFMLFNMLYGPSASSTDTSLISPVQNYFLCRMGIGTGMRFL
ncbi:MAG: serine/threonine protein kinase [Ruminococcaceae bacterium]|nr:serine/threonine protein kinase [Oscillospiraceae bacterium]